MGWFLNGTRKGRKAGIHPTTSGAENPSSYNITRQVLLLRVAGIWVDIWGKGNDMVQGAVRIVI